MRKTLWYLLLIALPLSLTIPALDAAAAVPASSLPSSGPGKPDQATIDAALKEFRGLSRHERRLRLRQSRKMLKEYRAEKRAGKSKRETDQVLLIILCFLLPPLAVYLKEEDVNSKFWISVLLTLLFWVPGIIYALLVIFDEA